VTVRSRFPVVLCIFLLASLTGIMFAGSTSCVIGAGATTYTLDVTVDGMGSVNLNATGPYNYNDVVQLNAIPSYGWSFLSWSGDLNGSANPATIVMNSNKAVTAHFVSTNTLYLTVATDKYLYGVGEMVNVSGNLMWEPNHIPVTDGLVGVEVRAPSGSEFVLRTRPTGIITGQNWLVNFTSLYTCDQNMIPKSAFSKGEDVWVYAQWRNYDLAHEHSVTMTAVFYTSTSAPVDLDYSSGTALPGGNGTYFFRATALKNGGATGNFVIYASLFSDFPRNGGYPYCPEWQATFTITSPTVPLARTSKSVSSVSSDGAYDFQFRLLSAHGYYKINATVFYYGVLVTKSATLYLPLIGDINQDGRVDILDAILMSVAFNSRPGNPNWNPKADLNKDNVVDILDAILLSTHFGESG
jgi:hypothetical protein